MGSERIVSLKFRHPDGKVRIVIGEFFGDGNLIIATKICRYLILNPIHVRHRTLSVGLRYVYPPIRGVDVFNITLDQMLSLRDGARNLDVLRWIGRNISAKEICRRSYQSRRHRSGQQLRIIWRRSKQDLQYYQEHHKWGQHWRQEPRADCYPARRQASRSTANNNTRRRLAKVDQEEQHQKSCVVWIDRRSAQQWNHGHGRNSRTVELDRQIAVEHDFEELNKAKDCQRRELHT